MNDLDEALDLFIVRTIELCLNQSLTDDERLLFKTYANEAKAGLRLILPKLRTSSRILEIGSGIGLLSSFLAAQGFHIVALEPAAPGFGFMQTLSRSIATQTDAAKLKTLSIGASELSHEKHGTFDLIFSLNVIEHIDDLDAAFAAMTNVLAVDGHMVHQCPNYAVPYEPHYGIPLVPMVPRITRFIFPHVKMKFPGVWDGLNFITARKARRLARQNGLYLNFDQKVMGDAIRRLERDPVYRNRQSNPFVRVISKLAEWGGLGLIDAIPPSLASPMVMRMSRIRSTGIN